MAGVLRKLQPKILVSTLGASLLPMTLLTGLGWPLINQPLIELEKTRLDDQVRAFQGYTAATQEGLQNLASSYGVWTDLFTAVNNRNQTWIQKEVTQQLPFATDVDAVKVMTRQGEPIAQAGTILQDPVFRQSVTQVTKTSPLAKNNTVVIETGDRQAPLWMVTSTGIYPTDGKGEPSGDLVLGQTLDQKWLQKFLSFSQPTTQLSILSRSGQTLVATNDKSRSSGWQDQHFQNQILPTIHQGKSFYRIEPWTGRSTIYAPLTSGQRVIAIAKIELVSEYFNRASVALRTLTLVGLSAATVLSIVLAQILAKQIANPINQLAKRSQTLASGDLDSPIPGLEAGGEIQQLAQAYQNMAQALKSLINDLEQRVAERTTELDQARQTLEERVIERTAELAQKHEQLQQAHDRLQQLNEDLTVQTQQLNTALKDLRLTQAQLIHAEKMSSLGQLVGGIAHEINNPINFIYANLNFAERYIQDLLKIIQLYQRGAEPQDIQDLLDDVDFEFMVGDLQHLILSMHNGADRIRQIVLSLRNFARCDESEMKWVDIHEGLDSTLMLLQHRLKLSPGREIKVIKQYADLPQIQCYPKQINQVFMNLLTNAIDALHSDPDPGEKTIVIESLPLSNQRIQIRIKDNGPGIPAHILPKVFDPFFTTKAVGSGTGLGLSVTHQIMENHQGQIHLQSQPHQGTEVILDLPEWLMVSRYSVNHVHSRPA